MAWTLKRLVISAFVIVHIGAVILWNLPECTLRQRWAGWTTFYLMPTGQWQGWDMFAPDPVRETVALRALVRDSRGVMYRYEFRRNADKSPWQAMLGFRHSKFATVLASPNASANREYAARSVLRSLELPAGAFPAEVELYYDVWPAPPVGDPPADFASAALHHTIQVYRFPSVDEVRQ